MVSFGRLFSLVCPLSSKTSNVRTFHPQIYWQGAAYRKGIIWMNTCRPSWTWLDVVCVYLGIMVLSFLWGIYGEPVMDYLTGLGLPDTRLAQFSISYLLQFLVTVGLVLLLSGIGRGTSWRDVGLAPLSLRNLVKYGIFGGVFLVTLVFLLSLPLQFINPDLPPQPYEQMLRTTQGAGQFLLLVVMAAVLAPLSEELFYRGMIYPLTRHSLGPLWGAISAGLLFGLAHWDLWRAVPLAVGGAILCYFYEKSGSIWATVTAHGVWNGIMSLLVYFS